MFNRGRAKQPAFLDDYAYLLEAYLTLYESTFDERWFVRSVELAEAILIRFHDPERGGFFSTGVEHTGLIARRKDLEDAPIPSGASAACYGLLRLSRLTGEASYLERGLVPDRPAPPHRPEAPPGLRPPPARDGLLRGARPRSGPGRRRRELAAVVRHGFYPHVVLAGGGGDAVPLLAGREPAEGEAAAYVCERFTCGLPLSRAEELAKSLHLASCSVHPRRSMLRG